MTSRILELFRILWISKLLNIRNFIKAILSRLLMMLFKIWLVLTRVWIGFIVLFLVNLLLQLSIEFKVILFGLFWHTLLFLCIIHFNWLLMLFIRFAFKSSWLLFSRNYFGGFLFFLRCSWSKTSINWFICIFLRFNKILFRQGFFL